MRFRLTDEGVFRDYEVEGKIATEKISSPLSVVAMTRDENNANWGRLLRWGDQDGQEHEWAMPMDQLLAYSMPVISTLFNGGVEILPGKERSILEYIQSERPSRRVRCTRHTGWHGSVYVFPHAAIQLSEAAEAETVVYQAEMEPEHLYEIAGTWDEWRENIGRPCRGNSRMLVAVSCAFAGPVLRLIGAESGGIHLWGGTSTGKTTVAMVAGSVMTGGRNDGTIRSWRSTSNGLEGIAALHNDSCLILDELNQLEPKDAVASLYMLANGKGKTRSRSDSSLRKPFAWTLSLISTGELTFEQHVNSGGGTIRGGIAIRLLDISADAGRKWGIFENFGGFDNPREFSNHLKDAVRKYHGAAFRHWIEALVGDPDGAAEMVREEAKQFVAANCPAGASPEVQRAVQRLSVIAGAGEVATVLGITGWEAGDASWGCKRCLDDWIAARGGVGSFDEERMVGQVRHFLQTCGDTRFRQNAFSLPVQQQPPYRGFAGCRGEGCYLIYPQTFESEVCAGHDPGQVSRALLRRGFLEKGSDRIQKQVRTGKQSAQRFYCIKETILYEDSNQ